MFTVSREDGTELVFAWHAYVLHDVIEIKEGYYDVVIVLSGKIEYKVSFDTIVEAIGFSNKLKNDFKSWRNDG